MYKPIKGRRYWYSQSATAAGRSQRHIGPESAQLIERIAPHKRARDHQRERRPLVSAQVRSYGLPAPRAQIGNLLAALATAGVFRLRGVLIGAVRYRVPGDGCFSARLRERPASLNGVCQALAHERREPPQRTSCLIHVSATLVALSAETAPCRRAGPRRCTRLTFVATCGYVFVHDLQGHRELKNNLSHYVRQIEAGKRIAVTAHGRVVAELVPHERATGAKRYDALIAAGVIEPAAYPDLPLAPWPRIETSPGTAAQLIDADRGE